MHRSCTGPLNEAAPSENTRPSRMRHSIPSFVPTSSAPSAMRTAAEGSARYCRPGTYGNFASAGISAKCSGDAPHAVIGTSGGSGAVRTTAPSRIVRASGCSPPHTADSVPSGKKRSARTGRPKPSVSHRQTTRASRAAMLSLFLA